MIFIIFCVELKCSLDSKHAGQDVKVHMKASIASLIGVPGGVCIPSFGCTIRRLRVLA